MKTEHSITRLCQVLEASPSGYYDWKKRQANPSPRARQDHELRAHIAEVCLQRRLTSTN